MAFSGSMQFPTYATSRLDGDLIRSSPEPIDWIHESYMEMIEDFSFMTPTPNDDKLTNVPESYSSINDPEGPEGDFSESIGNFKPPKDELDILIDLNDSRFYPEEDEVMHNTIPSLDTMEEKDLSHKEIRNESGIYHSCSTVSTDYTLQNMISTHSKIQKAISPVTDYQNTKTVISSHSSDSTLVPVLIEKQNKEVNHKKLSNQPHKKKHRHKTLQVIGDLFKDIKIAAKKPFRTVDKHF